ncbi:hypothetical protein DXG03_000161 [Asterophora parasitica]|uniref:AB hydrolase-1 domain-containing protein n=1 Tax=Asterophora parasitica TaxID=117018 RepID=A0A9P7GDY2_9AGAR|nr:hypothetical protein DXG03_000161 [Asterophora parasitica]
MATPRFTLSRYGWRNQIRPWVRKGYRVVVPDMLGYGETDKPEDPSEYSTKKLCGDLAALLDLLGIRRAVSASKTSNYNALNVDLRCSLDMTGERSLPLVLPCGILVEFSHS